MTKVVITNIDNNYKQSYEKILSELGGVKQFIKPNGKIYIKINTVSYCKHSYTSLECLGTFLEYLINAGAKPSSIYVMETSASGVFCRFIWTAIGMDKLVKKYNCNALYLDEVETMPVLMGAVQYKVDFPAVLVRDLVNNRMQNTYINLAPLKTHQATKITLTVKNQQGLLPDQSKRVLHNYYLHSKLADIYQFIRPDLGIIDGKYAIARGPVSPESMLNENLLDYNIMIGGTDCLAVDAVGSKILGYEPNEILHLKEASERGLGTIDLNNVEIISDAKLILHYKRVPYENIMPDNVQILSDGNGTANKDKEITIIKGTKRACVEGCFGMLDGAIGITQRDIGNKGRFTIICGMGIDKNYLNNLQEPILLNGPCAINEVGDFIKERYKKVLYIYNCGDLGHISYNVIKLMKADSITNLPMPIWKSGIAFIQAKLKGVNSIFPMGKK